MQWRKSLLHGLFPLKCFRCLIPSNIVGWFVLMATIYELINMYVVKKRGVNKRDINQKQKKSLLTVNIP